MGRLSEVFKSYSECGGTVPLDDDHIMGCVYAPEKLFECPWIAPEIVKKNAISAKRLAAYLN